MDYRVVGFPVQRLVHYPGQSTLLFCTFLDSAQLLREPHHPSQSRHRPCPRSDNENQVPRPPPKRPHRMQHWVQLEMPVLKALLVQDLTPASTQTLNSQAGPSTSLLARGSPLHSWCFPVLLSTLISGP